MQNGRDIRCSEIVRRASAMPPRERDRYIRDACADDEALLADVQRGLAIHESATIVPDAPPLPSQGPASILDSMALHRTIAPGPAQVSADSRRWIPGFVIERVLGEGGMGTVYLAEQEKPRRTVALKVVRAARMSGAMLRRFEHEAEILGRLQHPGIALIYQAGTFDKGDGPVPYYAMELVEGPALNEAARTMTLRRKLTLFARVCDAVQHAHQKGVIHRDLKPSNIHVDHSGQPKVLDFGVARLADPEQSEMTYHTAAGQLVGTLPYMSPEQVAGDPNDLDTRSDVYALGVILYELLTGRLPHEFSTPSLVDAVRTITESRIAPLSSFDPSLDGDLQTIVGKALERDRERRYASAAELGADVERFLRDEPILARPPTRTYLIAKFVARNRPLVALAAAAAVALVAGVAGTIWQAVRATEGQRLAELRQGEAERARLVAQGALADAQAVTDFLTGMLSSVEPENARGQEVTVREILDHTAATIPALADRPRVELTVRNTLGSTYRALGRPADAMPHLEAAAALAVRVHGPESREALTVRRAIAVALSELNRPEEAEPMIRDAAAMLERTLGERAPETALALGDLGRVLIENGRNEEAEATLRRSIELTTAALGPLYPELLTQKDHLGALLTDLGRFADAEAVLRDVLETRRQVHGPDSPMTAYSMTTLANALQKQGKHDETIALLTEALEIRRRCLPPDHPSLLINLANLATAMIGVGRTEESLPLLRETIERQRRVLGDDSPKVLASMGTLAYALEELGQLDEAESIYRRIVDISRAAGPGREVETITNFNNLAMLLWTRGKLDEAESVFAEVVDRATAALSHDHYLTAIFRNNYGALLTERGTLTLAEPHLVQSHAAIEKFFGPEHPRTVKSAGRLHALREAQSRGTEASRTAPAGLTPGG